jgi:DNA-binding MarR family transcriptional regulator
MLPARASGPASPAAPNGDPFRQGFVGYVYVGALKWRVMLRLHLELDGCRGRLWFAEAGGTEVWDTEQLVGQSPEELLRQARAFSAEELIRRFRASYDERRRFFALRAVTDELIEQVRGLNRAAVRAATHQLDGPRALREIAQLQERMHFLVDGMRDVAGKEGRS